MSFISNANGVTLGEGTFTNVQGNLNIYPGVKRRREDSEDLHVFGERKRKQRRKEDREGMKIIRNENLSLVFEIGHGPGYLLHAGKIKGRAVIVKVFDAGRNAREHLDATVLLSQGLLHPNVLRIEGISSPTSIPHFIAYEDAHRKKAEGPLAAALRDDLDTSIELGFKMISSLSSGINYLDTQGIALPLRPENIDVFLDINDRFLLSLNPPTNATNTAHPEEHGTHSVWTLLNGLCQKVLRLANRALHDEDIERTPTAFNSSRSAETSRPSRGPSLEQAIVQSEEAVPGDSEEAPPILPRREYVWRTMDVPQSLGTIAPQIAPEASIGARETLAIRTADSAVVSHDAPTIQEVCSHDLPIASDTTPAEAKPAAQPGSPSDLQRLDHFRDESYDFSNAPGDMPTSPEIQFSRDDYELQHGTIAAFEPSLPLQQLPPGVTSETPTVQATSPYSQKPLPAVAPQRNRAFITPHQSAVLHALFAQSRFPTTAMREEVGRSIGLSARRVRTWFQNHRRKVRRQTSGPAAAAAEYGPLPIAPKHAVDPEPLSFDSNSRPLVSPSPPLRQPTRKGKERELMPPEPTDIGERLIMARRRQSKADGIIPKERIDRDKEKDEPAPPTAAPKNEIIPPEPTGIDERLIMPGRRRRAKTDAIRLKDRTGRDEEKDEPAPPMADDFSRMLEMSELGTDKS
ncbi:hypothetical protein FB45DRAFT_1017232 [Roridomyces roridus]|uniref:Homeobox domain-containing protein n=1 Tax=Roridomyces roridus TaxID=1738132 RepID=A0AAD7CIH2_9AGAR|nr:hypothetical protein FB45DRAFT_1017232 [Roridomyces roridus]